MSTAKPDEPQPTTAIGWAKKYEGELVDPKRASDHLVRGVDFLFALTLGQGILLYSEFWRDPLHWSRLPVALALLAVYATTFTSFIDWHLAMEKRPYLVARPADATAADSERWGRFWERMRVWVDLAIVIVYAYILVNATVLIDDPDRTISSVLIGFPLVFVGYAAWARLRATRYPAVPKNRLRLLLGCVVVFTILWAAYTYIGAPSWLESGRAQNDMALGVVVCLVLTYRFINSRLK